MRLRYAAQKKYLSRFVGVFVPMSTPKFDIRKALVESLAFAGFLLAYYVPIIVDLVGLPLFDSLDPRARFLLSQALTVADVRFELLRNFLGHLLLAALFYSVLVWTALKTARMLGVTPALWRIALLCVGWVLLVSMNGLLFPLSDYSVPFDVLCTPSVAILAAAAVLGMFMVAASRRARVFLLSIAIGSGLLSLGAGGVERGFYRSESGAVRARNVILIGVDSLSPQLLQNARDQLPNLSGLMRASLRFDRAYTPVGRTFPSWISLLSGKSPAEHGAIFNLRGADRVERGNLVTYTLGAAGYRRVLAMDERRFANVDESYGFDEIVGPKAGVLDFVLQRMNDTPLSNLFLQTRLSSFIFPYSHFNVASHANYDAAGFVKAAVSALVPERPNFLAVHFESAHFPFRTRHAAHEILRPNGLLAKHLTALTVVDNQIGHLIDDLRGRGYLDDAMVVILSDHGESLGQHESSITRGGVSIEFSGNGHGFDLTSEYQNRIVLGLLSFRDGQPAGIAGSVRTQVSLADLRAAIEDFVVTGSVQLIPAHECMFVETGLRLSSVVDYRTLDERAIAAEAARYYRIDRLGRLRLREEHIGKLARAKDVGWRCSDRLTYYSRPQDRYFAYRIYDDGSRLVEDVPRVDDIARIEAYRERLMETAVR